MPFMNYADFKGILMPESNKKNPNETYTKKLSKTCCVQFWL